MANSLQMQKNWVGRNTLTFPGNLIKKLGFLFTATLLSTGAAFSQDNTPPGLMIKDITVQLDNNGQVKVTPNQLDNGTTDANNFVFHFGSDQTECGLASEGNFVNLQAPAGQVFWNIPFASYGNVTGDCANGFSAGSCHTLTSPEIIESLLLGKEHYLSEGIKASNDIFGDPCWGTVKSLAIEAAYTVSDLTFTNTGTYVVTVTATDEAGNLAKGNANITVQPFTVPCGDNGENILICHNGKTLCLPASAAASHLAHGDEMGDCNSGARRSQTISQEPVFKAFPNPFTSSSNLEFTLQQAGSFRAELVDIRGAVVKTIGAGEGEANKLYSYSIQSNNLTSGVYFVRLTSADGVKHLRLALN